jgi:hypothetical protein
MRHTSTRDGCVACEVPGHRVLSSMRTSRDREQPRRSTSRTSSHCRGTSSSGCAKVVLLLLQSSAVHAAYCHTGWTGPSPGNKCYQLTARVAGDSCAARCAGMGGTPACIEDYDENDYIVDSVCPDYCGDFHQLWIGLYQSPTDQGPLVGWDQWRDGCSSSFRNWVSVGSPIWDEPNHHAGIEACAVMSTASNSGMRGGWYDLGCEVRARPRTIQSASSPRH